MLWSTCLLIGEAPGACRGPRVPVGEGLTRLQALHEAVFSNIIRNQHKNER